MENKEQYLSLISEIIKKQAVILGPDIAILKAKSVPGIVVKEDGTVSDITTDPKMAIQSLINIYVELSGMIVKSALSSVFEKYPGVGIENK